jgi:acyl-coenzyme A thioesterase PaaI-like protein
VPDSELMSGLEAPLTDAGNPRPAGSKSGASPAGPRADSEASVDDACGAGEAGSARTVTGVPAARRRSFADRAEAFVSRLSTTSNFWHRICSLIWLPFAFRSGIKLPKRLDDRSFAAELPFRRFNRNWYNAMAGAALLGNAEIAGGMYVFGVCGGDYTVVCKHMEYRFLRPCFGPAVYRISPRGDINAELAHRGEFNLTIDMDVYQTITKPGDREKRVGRCSATFHVTPKMHQKTKQERRAT